MVQSAYKKDRNIKAIGQAIQVASSVQVPQLFKYVKLTGDSHLL